MLDLERTGVEEDVNNYEGEEVNNDVESYEEDNTEVQTEIVPKKKSHWFGKTVTIGGAIGIGIAAWRLATKEKREMKKEEEAVKLLSAKGYTFVAPEPEVEGDCETVYEETEENYEE